MELGDFKNKQHIGSIQGWICPYCNTIYSPMVSSCGCKYKPKEEPKSEDKSEDKKGFNPIKPFNERT